MIEKFNINDEIQKIKDAIIKNYDPEKIILFGSCARGDNTKDSDVDICIIKTTDELPRERIIRVRKAIPHDFPVDVIVYTPEEEEKYSGVVNSFIWMILKEGKVIYEKPNCRKMA